MKEKKPRKKPSILRIALCAVLGTLGAILLLAIIYVVSVFVRYHRIPDNQVLEVHPDPMSIWTMDSMPPPQSIKVIPGEKVYTIMAYNIGFGAYTQDYSFFMDGGKYSRARSRDGLIENLNNIGNMIGSYDPDFVLLQEVDEDGTRSWHVDERDYMIAGADPYSYVYARNFDSPFLLWPLNEPHGANKSGLLTMSDAVITSSIRRSLPVSKSITKIVDLDRCYTVTRIPVESDASPAKELVLYNVHLSAYGMDDSVRDGQVAMLVEDMQAEYEKGNYVICGGDFNHNLRVGSSNQAPDWAQPFPFVKLPATLHFAYRETISKYDNLTRSMTQEEFTYCEEIMNLLMLRGHYNPAVYTHDTCRNADEPYNPQTTFTVMADGFIVSENVEVIYYENVDLQYAYSDHDPVYMEFRLKE